MRENFHDDENITGKQKFDWRVMKSLLPRFKPHLRSLATCVLLLMMFTLLSLANPLLVRHAIDVNFVNRDMAGLLLTAGLFIGVLILSFTFNYLQNVRLEIVGQKIIQGIRVDIFTRLLFLQQRYFDRNPVGKLLSRIESDTEALRTLFTQTVVAIISDLVMMVGMVVVMFGLSPRLTLVILCLAPPVIFIVRYFNRRILPIFVEVRKKTAEVYAFLEEYLRGSKVVQAFDQQAMVTCAMNAVNEAKFKIEYPGELLSNYFGHSVFLLSTVGTILTLGLGGKWVLARPDLLTIGTLVAFMGYIDRFFGPIFHLSEQLNVIQRAFAAAQRIQDILTTPLPAIVTSTHDAPKFSEPDIAPPAIEFRNVWFAYNDNHWILKDVSFTVHRGQRIAVVGPTGGGKTTITSLLFRFYEPQRGRILVDGLDIQSVPLDVLRRKMGLVLQDIVLFHGSILDNIRLDDTSLPETKVWEALAMVGARDVVANSPDSLYSNLAEGGNNLSVGEKQLLSFARALAFDPQILVLDEATSSVDPSTEQLLQSAIESLLRGRTALLIAHRLQTIRFCDEILVVEEGQIKERGTHDELLRQGRIYANLIRIQRGTGAVRI